VIAGTRWAHATRSEDRTVIDLWSPACCEEEGRFFSDDCLPMLDE